MSLLLENLLLTISMYCFQDKFASTNTRKIFVTCPLLICTFSIRRLGNVDGGNFFFERKGNNNNLVLSTFTENLFDLNHVKTFYSSKVIPAKSASMFFWDRNKFVSSANITYMKGLDTLNRSFT